MITIYDHNLYSQSQFGCSKVQIELKFKQRTIKLN